MRVSLYSNGDAAFVSSFVGKFVGGVCLAAASSLKAPRPARSLRFELERDAIRLQVDGVAVPLNKNQGFAETIVRDTIQGMIQHLKGVDPEGIIQIEVDIENQS